VQFYDAQRGVFSHQLPNVRGVEPTPRSEAGDPRACAAGRGLHQPALRHRGVVDEVERAKNRTKSRVRAKVEHPFRVIKRVFGFVKVGCRRVAMNTQRLWVTCGLANLFMVRRRLLRV
jgi:hypothetical protein